MFCLNIVFSCQKFYLLRGGEWVGRWQNWPSRGPNGNEVAGPEGQMEFEEIDFDGYISHISFV